MFFSGIFHLTTYSGLKHACQKLYLAHLAVFSVFGCAKDLPKYILDELTLFVGFSYIVGQLVKNWKQK